MILRFALVTTIIGFVDAILGVSGFVYLNVEEYRHKQFGSGLEIKWSYITASYAFVKGLALCIPAAQVMVNKKKALIARWASILWLVLTLIQVGFISELLYYYFYPSKSFIVIDLVLTILRICHTIFLLLSIIFVFLFWSELGPLLPPKPPKAPKPPKVPKPKAPKKVKAGKGKKNAQAHEDTTGPGMDVEEAEQANEFSD